jgi:hypothetical protein
MRFIFSSRAFILLALAIPALSACTAGVAPTVTPSLSSTASPSPLDTVFLVSDAWSTKPGAVFELFSIGSSAQPTRLTTCTGCQTLGASPSLDRNRVALRRVTVDTNKDGRLDDLDRASLLLVNLARQIEGPFLPEGWTTSGVDWSADGTFLVHTSSPDSGTEGLYTIDANATNNQLIISDPGVRLRGARVNPSMNRAAYERIASTGVGKSEIWIGNSQVSQTKVTDGGTVGEALPNSLYLVGSDAGPDYSPDGNNLAFRRLTSTSVAGGTWDILVVSITGGAPRVIASGPQFRSDPDWSKDGIVFAEANTATGGMDIVVIDPTTNARKVLQSFAAGYRATAPRWIAGATGG